LYSDEVKADFPADAEINREELAAGLKARKEAQRSA
jgi:hypothetical protein